MAIKKISKGIIKKSPVIKLPKINLSNLKVNSAFKFLKNRKNIIKILVVIILFCSLLLLAKFSVVAIVNGKPIWRLSLIRELQNQAGKKTLDMLVTKQLILDEASKRKIIVSKEEVDKEIKAIEENITQRGQNLDQLLQAQGLTKTTLADQISLQKLVEKLAGSPEVTEQEINEYYEQNKEFSFKDTPLVEVQVKIKGQLAQQKLNDNIQTLIQSLQEKAKIRIL